MSDSQVQAAIAAGATGEDLSTIQRFKQRAAEFADEKRDLIRVGALVAKTNDEKLLLEYADLVNRSDGIQSKVMAATTAIDDGIKWARDQLGLSGLRTLGALGLWPVVVMGVVLGASTILGKWLLDARNFKRRVQERMRVRDELIAGGATPQEATRQAADLVPADAPGFSVAIGKAGKYLLIGAAVYWLFRRLA